MIDFMMQNINQLNEKMIIMQTSIDNYMASYNLKLEPSSQQVHSGKLKKYSH